MEEHIRLLAVNGDIAGGAWLDRVGWCRDILCVAIFLTRLFRVCLDGRVLAKVGVGYKELEQVAWVSADASSPFFEHQMIALGSFVANLREDLGPP